MTSLNKKKGLKRCAGVLMHPTCLYGKFGIGDLGPACYEFIDFLSEAKQKLWQILPITPTSVGDSPYQSFSTFAGNYLLISPEVLMTKKYISECDLNNIPDFDTDSVNYEKVIAFKSKLFLSAYKNFKKNNDAQREFVEFDKKNKYWLDDYALFVALKKYFIGKRKNVAETNIEPEIKNMFADKYTSVLKDYYYGAVWNTWPKEVLLRDKTSLLKYEKKLASEIDYQKFLQFEFFQEWAAIKSYANSKQISIIGDMPIFVAFDSADVWANKNLFKLDNNYFPAAVAGVPPDYFSYDGQLWGNPVYDWHENKNSGYGWWLTRIKNVLDHVDILRIDHFRGFESYYEIPFNEKTAVNGKWFRGPGKDLFDLIETKLGDLNIIAEDLGMINDKVMELRESCGFPGMRVLQFAFDNTKNNYHMPHNFGTRNIVAYTGTHDNDTTVGWYKKMHDDSKDIFRRYMNVPGNDPAWDLIRLLYSSVAAYAIVPVQDLMGLDSNSRMNFPGQAFGNWKFRFTREMLFNDIKDKLVYLCNLFDR